MLNSDWSGSVDFDNFKYSMIKCFGKSRQIQHLVTAGEKSCKFKLSKEQEA